MLILLQAAKSKAKEQTYASTLAELYAELEVPTPDSLGLQLPSGTKKAVHAAAHIGMKGGGEDIAVNIKTSPLLGQVRAAASVRSGSVEVGVMGKSGR